MFVSAHHFSGAESREFEVSRQRDHPVVIRMKLLEGWWDFVLSPNGTKLALFDGAKVQIYCLE
jgi:hypothetical protein